MSIESTYTNIEEIGSGGGGTVYRAFHVRMQKYVILKKIHSSIQSQVDVTAELNILKNLRHEYLPAVFDFLQENGATYTVMDYIPGDSFANLIKKGVTFTRAQVEKYAIQLGKVLTYLHGQKPAILHGDIKPANIMLTPDDNICLIDFNISQLQNDSIDLNMGYTKGYASPEQVQMATQMNQYVMNHGGIEAFMNQSGVGTNVSILPVMGIRNALTVKMDERSDIYSVGAFLYRILSTVRPDNDFQNIIPIGDLEPDCPEGLKHLIEKSMELDPANRFQSAEEFLQAAETIHKMDKRYKALVVRQRVSAVCLALLSVACLGVAALGYRKMQTEKQDAYDALIEKMWEAQESLDEDALIAAYEEAISINAENMDAYIEMANYYYNIEDYQSLQEYLIELDLPSFAETAERGDLYYLLACSYLENEEPDYVKAINYFKKAIEDDDTKGYYYTSYAIALARNGNFEEADQILSTAIGKNVQGDVLYLAKAEVAGHRGNVSEAGQYFRRCIDETKDDYTKYRAYVYWAKCLPDDSASLLEQERILKEAYQVVAEAYKVPVLEQLSIVYNQLGEGYEAAFLETQKEIVRLSRDTFQTHMNITVLYMKLADYEAAEKELDLMTDKYGEDYRIYSKRFMLALFTKDYDRCEAYYQTAISMMEQAGIRKDADAYYLEIEPNYRNFKEAGY